MCVCVGVCVCVCVFVVCVCEYVGDLDLQFGTPHMLHPPHGEHDGARGRLCPWVYIFLFFIPSTGNMTGPVEDCVPGYVYFI